MNEDYEIFADIFIVINRVFSITFTYSMNKHSQIYWCNTFTDMLYTAFFAGKKMVTVFKLLPLGDIPNI